MAENTETNITYPQVHVQLSGEDGNAFAILGRVTNALRDAGVKPEEVAAFRDKAMESQSYSELLNFIGQTVEVS